MYPCILTDSRACCLHARCAYVYVYCIRVNLGLRAMTTNLTVITLVYHKPFGRSKDQVILNHVTKCCMRSAPQYIGNVNRQQKASNAINALMHRIQVVLLRASLNGSIACRLVYIPTTNFSKIITIYMNKEVVMGEI